MSFWSAAGVPVSHLQCEDADDRLVVANAVFHVAGVQVLPDLQRVLLVLLQLPDLLRVRSDHVFVRLVGGWALGSEPPQNPVGPGGFALLTAVTGGEQREGREVCFSQETVNSLWLESKML